MTNVRLNRARKDYGRPSAPLERALVADDLVERFRTAMRVAPALGLEPIPLHGLLELFLNGSLTLAALFAKGPIEITLLGGNGRRVKMGIAAPPELCILRVDKGQATS